VPNPNQYIDTIIKGDCTEVLKSLPNSSIDFIVTSPPYADNRKGTYGGIPVKRYVEWFLPISEQLKRVLKPDGSFILNIKERVVDGERGVYVYELVMAMRMQGWLWTEEYIWHKKNTYPGKWPNRFRDLWEHCYHFTKSTRFRMYQDAVKVPVGTWAEKRLARLSETDKTRDESRTKSGFGKNVSNWVGRDTVYPGNVLHLATESSNKEHSATFPTELPAWFIKLFTKEGDIVLDPFMGSGTTAVAAMRLGRHFVGIELNEQYCKVALGRIAKEQHRLDAFTENRDPHTVVAPEKN
jgi:site-specific DNA-methyltransferase (adenine-specific)/site-specific DNA-methyltransferase (cytosine-N4-specific)